MSNIQLTQDELNALKDVSLVARGLPAAHSAEPRITSFSCDITGNAATASDAKADSTLDTTLDAKAPLESPVFTGTPEAPTAPAGTSTNQIATTSFVDTAVSALVNGAEADFDTLKELADRIDNDAGFANSMNTLINAKANSTSLDGLNERVTTLEGADYAAVAVAKQNELDQYNVHNDTSTTYTLTANDTNFSGTVTLVPEVSLVIVSEIGTFTSTSYEGNNKFRGDLVNSENTSYNQYRIIDTDNNTLTSGRQTSRGDTSFASGSGVLSNEQVAKTALAKLEEHAGLVIARDTAIAERDTANEDLGTANAALTTANADLATANADLATANAALNQFSALDDPTTYTLTTPHPAYGGIVSYKENESLVIDYNGGGVFTSTSYDGDGVFTGDGPLGTGEKRVIDTQQNTLTYILSNKDTFGYGSGSLSDKQVGKTALEKLQALDEFTALHGPIDGEMTLKDGSYGISGTKSLVAVEYNTNTARLEATEFFKDLYISNDTCQMGFTVGSGFGSDYNISLSRVTDTTSSHYVNDKTVSYHVSLSDWNGFSNISFHANFTLENNKAFNVDPSVNRYVNYIGKITTTISGDYSGSTVYFTSNADMFKQSVSTMLDEYTTLVQNDVWTKLLHFPAQEFSDGLLSQTYSYDSLDVIEVQPGMYFQANKQTSFGPSTDLSEFTILDYFNTSSDWDRIEYPNNALAADNAELKVQLNHYISGDNDVKYLNNSGELNLNFAFHGGPITREELTSVIIGSDVTDIGSQIAESSSLTSITLPDSVTMIRDYAFRDCSSLTSITLPNSVTLIGMGTFSGCSSLPSITLPDNVNFNIIEIDAFAGCSSLTSITLPSSLTTIGAGAFSGCSSLTSIINLSNIILTTDMGFTEAQLQ